MKTLVMCSLLLVVGCGEKEEEEEVSKLFKGEGQVTSWTQYNGQTASLLESMLLTPSDFDDAEEAYGEIAESSVDIWFDSLFEPVQTGAASIEMISGSSEINYYAADYAEYDSVQECVDGLLGAAVIKTVDSEYRFDLDIVLTPCFTDKLSAAYSDYTATLKASVYGQCDESDLSAMNGMTYAEIEAEEIYADSAFCRQNTSYASAIIYTESYNRSWVDSEGVTTVSESAYTTKTATYDANGRSCQKKRKGEEIYFEDGCVSYVHVDYGSGSGLFTKLTTNGLVQAFGEHDWYKSGAIDVSYGGWEGAVTFDGADTVPTWTLSNGTAEVTGDFAEEEEDE